MSQILYSWKFSDSKNRGNLWYTIAFSLVLGLAIWWFLTKQYGMSFIILLIAGLVYFIENNSQEEIAVVIKDQWIKIDQSFYDYGKIQSYNFVFQWENPIFLRLFLKKQALRTLDLRIDENIIHTLKDILPQLIEESEKQEITLSEKLIKTLKL